MCAGCGGSDVRIILAASAECGLLNQSQINKLLMCNSEVRKRSGDTGIYFTASLTHLLTAVGSTSR